MKKSIFRQYSYLQLYLQNIGNSIEIIGSGGSCKNLYFTFLPLIFSFKPGLRAPSVSWYRVSKVSIPGGLFLKELKRFDNC